MQLTLPTTINSPTKCRACESERLLYIKGNVVARLVGTNVEGEGEVELLICLECGQVQWPMKTKNYGWSE